MKKAKNRIRKSTKIVYTVIAVIILLASLYGLVTETQKENIRTKNKQIYSYTNKFNYDYNVNLIKNKYIKEKQTKDQSAFVTDLMDTTDVTLNYEYLADKIANIKGEYYVLGRMEVVYTRDGEEQKIWKEDETILEKEKINEKSNLIKINKKLKVDLKKKNKLLEEFKQQMGMTIDAKYSIILYINIDTEVEGEPVEVRYTPMVQIELANKTTKILGENNLEESKYISKEIQVGTKNTKVHILLSIIGLIVSIAIIKYLSKFRTSNIIKDEFRQELNRILKLCQDKIVQVKNKPIANDEDIVDVKDFGEIVKVSEELFKPILYYYDNFKEEAWFCVMTGKIMYKYILKR